MSCLYCIKGVYEPGQVYRGTCGQGPSLSWSWVPVPSIVPSVSAAWYVNMEARRQMDNGKIKCAMRERQIWSNLRKSGKLILFLAFLALLLSYSDPPVPSVPWQSSQTIIVLRYLLSLTTSFKGRSWSTIALKCGGTGPCGPLLLFNVSSWSIMGFPDIWSKAILVCLWRHSLVRFVLIVWLIGLIQSLPHKNRTERLSRRKCFCFACLLELGYQCVSAFSLRWDGLTY